MIINLMIVEDNKIVREGLANLLGAEADIIVTAQEGDGHSAINTLRSGVQVDVVMADWNMPEMDSLELTSILREEFPEIKVIILTMHSKQDYKEKARAAGAKGYILKENDLEDMIEDIRHVAKGGEVYR